MTQTLMTPHERALVDHAWSRAGDHASRDKFRSYLRGFYRWDDSPALRDGLMALLADWECYFG